MSKCMDTVAHAGNPSTWEVKEGGSRIHSFQKKKKEEKKWTRRQIIEMMQLFF